MRSAKLARALIRSLQTSYAAVPAECPSIQCLLNLSHPPSGSCDVASNSLLPCDSPSLFSQTRKHAAKADPVDTPNSVNSASDAGASTPASATRDAEAMQSVLSQFLPSDDANAVYRPNDEDRLRFGDLPATSKLVRHKLLSSCLSWVFMFLAPVIVLACLP